MSLKETARGETQCRREKAKRQKQRLERYGYQSRNAKDGRQPQKVRWEAWNGFSSKPIEKHG